jgi:predicted XRE-type DNA-binding protein
MHLKKRIKRRPKRKSRNNKNDCRIIESTGNVFLDLGFPPQEAANLFARTHLIIAIERIIKRRKLTQSAAAKLFHVTQPRISDLMRGKIEVFSVDSLMEMLGRAGAKVEFHVIAA